MSNVQQNENINTNTETSPPKTDYAPQDNNQSPGMNEGSKKTAKIFGSLLKYFSLTIILYLIMSYISNNYIAGLGINFIPLFLPIGNSFYCKPVLGSIFHSDKLPENSDNFFKKINIANNCGEKETVTYYELVEMGASFLGVLKGVSGLSALLDESNQTDVNLTPIFLVDYNKSCWYQKLVLVIFGAIQLIAGIAFTMFSSFAYLFSGKHGFLLNLPEEKKRLEKLKKYPLEDLGISMMKTKTDQSTIKSGWTKFALFFNFINFIFVDKLTYGTRYFIEDKHSSFKDRFKYFFLIVFVLIFYSQLKGIFSDSIAGITWGIILILILYIFLAKTVLNPNKTTTPFANYEGLLNEIQYAAQTNSNSPNKDYTFNKLEKDITQLKDILNNAIKNYSNTTDKIAKELKFERVNPVDVKKLWKEQKEKSKEAWNNFKNKFKKKPETTTEIPQTNPSSIEVAANVAEKNMNPTVATQSGGKLKVKPQYRKRIIELKKELLDIKN